MKDNKIFSVTVVFIVLFFIVGAFLVRKNIEIGVQKYLGEVEAISYEARSLIIKNREDKLIKVFFKNQPQVVDHSGMKVDFTQIRPGSIIEINGSINEFKSDLRADFIKIGLSPNIVVFKPISFEKLANELYISGEVRSRNGELKIRIKNQDNKVLIFDTLKLKDFKTFEYVKFEKIYSRAELKLKPEDKLLKIEIFQLSPLDNSESDLVSIFVLV